MVRGRLPDENVRVRRSVTDPTVETCVYAAVDICGICFFSSASSRRNMASF